MSMLVLLLDGTDVAISSSQAIELARMGVTSISICRGQTTVGIVLEGWAFDTSSADDAARLIGEPAAGRLLLPTVQMAVSPLRVGMNDDVAWAE